MQAAYKALCKQAIADGNVISVWDGEEWADKRSNKIRSILSSIESVEEAEIVIRDVNGKKIGWALVSAFGLEPEETIIDCGAGDYVDAWFNANT